MSTTVSEYLRSGLEPPSFTHVGPHPQPSPNEAYEFLAENVTLQKSSTLFARLNEPIGLEQQRTSKRGYTESLKHLKFLINEHSIVLFYTLHVLERLNVLSNMVEASIMYELPFTSKPLSIPGLRDTITYTPDFTICEGHLKTTQDYDSLFLSPAGQRLTIGEFKYRGTTPRLRVIKNTIGVTLADVGQCLWYCMLTKTRFCVVMNDHEMVFIEFECKDQEIADASRLDAMESTITEMSSPQRPSTSGSSVRSSPPGLKRGRGNTTATNSSAISDEDRHMAKRTEPQVLSSSDPYMPSSPGDMNARRLEDLKDAGKAVTGKFVSFSINEFDKFPELFSQVHRVG
ncbi:hypothetical protein F5Y09DRAFT_254956 [Xylaria sp. FL1042]|nr:hypothetical protein F5Y09DRAFT_254956 [Xylaria sp. FL1042]